MAYGIDALCVGAHPDDVEIGMGGTVAGMIRRGLSVSIVDITNGEPTPNGTPERRASESEAAAKKLGVKDRYLLSGSNRYLQDTLELRRELAEVIRETRPRMLFIPYKSDAHPDHIAAHAIAVAARFTAKLSKTDMKGEPYYPERIYSYAAVHQRIDAVPTFYVDIAQDLDTKTAAVECYQSQFAAQGGVSTIAQWLDEHARSLGKRAGCEAAEPFFAFEPIALVGPEVIL